MCGTVSDSDDWREPSGSPSESNSSTEWGGYTPQEQHAVVVANAVAVAFKEKLMNGVDDDDDQQPSPARGARDHSIKEFVSFSLLFFFLIFESKFEKFYTVFEKLLKLKFVENLISSKFYF